MSIEQINDDLKLLDKEHKVSLIIDFYHSVQFFLHAKNIQTCSLFLYDDDMFGEPFDAREAFLIEYKSPKGQDIKKDFNVAMEDVGLNKIKIDYIAPCFEIQDFLKTVKAMIVDKEQSLDAFMDKYIVPSYTKIYLKNKLDENLIDKNQKHTTPKI